MEAANNNISNSVSSTNGQNNKVQKDAQRVRDISFAALMSIGSLLSTGVLVVAGLGMGGVVSSQLMGGMFAAGFGTASLICLAIIIRTKDKDSRFGATVALASSLVYAILGAVTAAGYLSCSTLGWCYFGSMIGGVVIGSIAAPIIAVRSAVNKVDSDPQYEMDPNEWQKPPRPAAE